jgi:hypothetical protein
MDNVHVNLERIQSFRQTIARNTDHSRSVNDLFVELLQILDRIKNSPRTSSGHGKLERWEDAEYIYLQTNLDSVFDEEIDVNVHDGRVYVRLER